NTASQSFQSHRYGALDRELESVRKKVGNDLLPHIVVNVDRFFDGWAFHREPQPGAFHCGAEYACEFRRKACKIGRLVRCLYTASFNPREIKERVYQLKEPYRISTDRQYLFVAIRTEPFANLRHHFFQRTEHQSKRSAELVTDIAEEGGLGAID